MFASRVYVGHTGHARLSPVKHSFQYPVNYYVFDLDELPKLSNNLYLFGYNKSRPIAIYDDDYLGRDTPGTPIKQKLFRLLTERQVDPTPISRVELVTSARYFGHAFNPVNFYYCYRVNDKPDLDPARAGDYGKSFNREHLYAMVVEINNTFGETHVHVMKSDESSLPSNVTEDPYQTKKLSKSKFLYNWVRWRDFHVSPFNDRLGYFHFQFDDVRSELHVKISQLDINFNPVVIATLRGARSYLLCDSVIATNVVRYPITALMTFPRILVQAGKLHFKKKLPIYVKPNPTQPDTIVLIPPGSLQSECLTRVSDAWRAVFDTRAQVSLRCLSVRMPDGTTRTYGDGAASTHRVELTVSNYDFFTRVYEHGALGSALAFMADDVSCPPEQMRDWLAFLHATRRATCDGSAHKDSRAMSKNGNKLTVPESTALEKLLASFLDSRMSFQCPALGTHSVPERSVIDISEHVPTSRGPPSLDSAQVQGINQVLDLAVIKREHRVLDLSNGWGALTAVLHERDIGCAITCVVLTVQQLLHVRRRIPAHAAVTVLLLEDFVEQHEDQPQYDVIFAAESSEMYAAHLTQQRVQSRVGRASTATRQELYRVFELCYARLAQGGQLIVQAVHRNQDTATGPAAAAPLVAPIVRPSLAAKWRLQKARVSRWLEIKVFEHITEYVINPFELEKRFHRNFTFVPNARIVSAPDSVPDRVDIIAAATGSKLTLESMRDLGSADYARTYQHWADNIDKKARESVRTSGSIAMYDNATNSERERQLIEEQRRQFSYYLRGAQHLFELGLFGVSRFVFSKQM